jgi:hypothetical protein
VKPGAVLALDRAGQAPERYRKAPAEYFLTCTNPDSLRGMVLFCARTGRSWILPSAKSYLLGLMDRFRTLSEHREALKLGPGSTDLQDFADAGLLTCESELRAALAQGGDAEGAGPEGPIGTAVFVTRDRAASLERAVKSAVANARRHDRALEIVVIDDSPGDDAQAANRAALAGVTGAAVIRYAGPDERRRYAERLAAMRSMDPAMAVFALLGDPRCPVTTGAARNSALLDQVGQRFVLADDDVQWQTTLPARPDAPLAICEETEPTRAWFHASHDELLASLRLGHEDVMGAHERLLGHSLPALLQTWLPAVDTTALGDHLERRLRHRTARVRVTAAGAAGDSGLDDPDYVAFDPESNQRLCRDEAFFQQVWQSRQIVRVAPQLTLTVPLHLRGFNLGLDGVRLLPPFSPVQRHSERLFAHVLLRCFGEALQGHLDFCLLHQPPEPRAQDVDAWRRSKERLRFPDLLASVLGPVSPVKHAADPERELADVGTQLVALAGQKPRAFSTDVRRAVWRHHHERGWALDRWYHDAPLLIQKRLEEAQRLSQRSLHLPDYWVPRDLQTPGGDSQGGAAQLAQELLHRMGRLLLLWPGLWQAAGKLRDQGVRLAPPLANAGR